jgi:hypothetical protein
MKNISYKNWKETKNTSLPSMPCCVESLRPCRAVSSHCAHAVLCRVIVPMTASFNFINPLTPELNPSAQRCLPKFLLGILIFKGLTARHLYKSFGVKGLIGIYNLIV